ncbi:fungal specific transcription factor domain-containing protein [Colletotrichum costaricense]|uniref:Fungal specific transcription factor domain-containing protein n=1 Tax=Colletotrichum costaricense TaxID=1209916 RepID=A0AAI9YPP3_9PEZI|nr:fungal specific transcription factor domain-containing protein [Colletotrichum costaricense]KAK1518960.1 fungal specific transcription factor domain-containing protein [Colletotrichum costaricense]
MAVLQWPSVPNLEEDGDLEFPGIVLLKQQQQQQQQETDQHYHRNEQLSQQNYFGFEEETKQDTGLPELGKETDSEVRKHSLDHHVSRDLDLNLTFSLDLGIDGDIDLPAAHVDAAESGILAENNYNAIAGLRQQSEPNLTPSSSGTSSSTAPGSTSRRPILFSSASAPAPAPAPASAPASGETPFAHPHSHHSLFSLTSPPLHPHPHPHPHTHPHPRHLNNSRTHQKHQKKYQKPYQRQQQQGHYLQHQHHAHSPYPAGQASHQHHHHNHQAPLPPSIPVSVSVPAPPTTAPPAQTHPEPAPEPDVVAPGPPEPVTRLLPHLFPPTGPPPITSRPEKFVDEPLHHYPHDSVAAHASRSPMDVDMSSTDLSAQQQQQQQQLNQQQSPQKSESPSQAPGTSTNPAGASPNAQGSSAAAAAAAAAAANHLSFRSEKGDNAEERSPRAPSVPAPGPGTFPPRTPAVYHTTDGTPSSTYTESQARKEEVDSGTYLNLVMKPKFTRAPITDAGRVAYLGESSNLTLLVHDRQGSSDVVHYPLPENVRGSRARLTELDNVEIDILHQRGAFLLPPRSLCDELIDSYFKWIHPIVPVINRTRFMRQYRDPKNPPSLLLLQAVLLAGSRVCTNPQLMDANGSTTPAALTFYKRAKALYDANYEDDRVTIVQSLLLMGWYWEGPEDVTKNVFYWSRVATIVAQGSGMHRSVEQSQLSRSDKRLWKRIWWTLFTRDRSVAVALGRPVHINLDDSDVEMLTEDDFIEDDGDRNSEYPPDPIHVQFFMQYVKLCEIMGLVLSQQYSVASKGRQRNAIDLTHSDMALADWLQNCPKIVYWEVARHHFWSALLHSNYYTTLCLLHRAHMPPNGGSRFPDDSPYPSRNIAFQAAAMITSIIENLAAHGELRFCPAFVVYSLFSALIMHVYQMRSPVPSIQQVTQDRLRTCMQALKEVSRVWLVGKMVYTLFESIIGNKVLEERLQKAAGKRHRKAQQALAQLEQQQRPQDVAKRKYDDMAIDFSVNTPTPQESYERSRPQTPSHMKGDGGSNQQTMPPPITSPNARQNADTFMGGTSSRPQTRPATPFNPSFSVPATPPDLYLVTRNSPNISQSLWENFQPDQLFPDSASMPAFPHMSPPPNHHGLDTGLMAQLHNQNTSHGLPAQSTQFQARGPTKQGLSGSPQQGANVLGSGMQGFQQQQPQQQQQAQGQGQSSNNNNSLNSNLWTANFDGLMPDGQSPSDSWSTGSAQGQPVPNTLNVEDWFQFFGINNGDLASMNLDLGLGPQ